MKSKLLKLIGFLLPFELLASYVAYAIFKPVFGEFYRLLFNGGWGVILISIILGFTKIKRTNLNFLYIGLLFIVGGFWEYLVTLFLGGMAMEAITQFICGFFFPALLFITIINLPQRMQDDFFKSWYIGTVALIVLAFGATLYYYGSLPEWFKDKDPAFKLISFRYAYDEETISNGMMLVLGNFNKASNYLLMMLLFSVRLLGGEKNSKFLLYFWLIGIITLFVLFSRLALLLLPVVYYASGIKTYSDRYLNWKYIYSVLVVLICYVTLKYIDLIKPTFEYLVYSKFDENSEDLGVLGTGNNRFKAWALLSDRLNDIGLWVHGMGVGAYGMEHGGSKDSGTHNLIFDHFFASGIWLPLIILYMSWCAFLKGIIKKDLVLMFGVPIILALFFREYSFSYLFVTSQGGVVFVLLIYIAYKDHEKHANLLNA